MRRRHSERNQTFSRRVDTWTSTRFGIIAACRSLSTTWPARAKYRS